MHQCNSLRDKIGPQKCNLKYLLNNKEGMKEMLRYIAGIENGTNIWTQRCHTTRGKGRK
jgi:hypothetical protein